MLIMDRDPTIRDNMAARPLCCLSPIFDIIAIHLLSGFDMPGVSQFPFIIES